MSDTTSGFAKRPSVPLLDPAVATAANLESLVENTDLYLFGEPKSDRARLVAQTFLFSTYLRDNARYFINIPVHSFLDLGCGDGQLTLVLKKAFPTARAVGVDNDPQAIEMAQLLMARSPGIPGPIEYVLGNVQEKLPDGPFDLIYVSVVMIHMTKPRKVLQLIHNALTPGGYVWIKDIHPEGTMGTIDHPIWKRYSELFFDTLGKMGRQPRISIELPQMLEEEGFTEITTHREYYTVNDATLSGRIALTVGIGAFMNARKVIAKFQNIPEEELAAMCQELLRLAPTLRGEGYGVNILARSPMTNTTSMTEMPAIGTAAS